MMCGQRADVFMMVSRLELDDDYDEPPHVPQSCVEIPRSTQGALPSAPSDASLPLEGWFGIYLSIPLRLCVRCFAAWRNLMVY